MQALSGDPRIADFADVSRTAVARSILHAASSACGATVARRSSAPGQSAAIDRAALRAHEISR
jgi:hypothetical protein